MEKVYLASDITQAQLIVNMLTQQFIPAHIEQAHQSGGLGELAVMYPQVWVKRAQDVPRAIALIESFETGATKQDTESVCSKCSEKNPATFEFCWACGTDLD